MWGILGHAFDFGYLKPRLSAVNSEMMFVSLIEFRILALWPQVYYYVEIIVKAIFERITHVRHTDMALLPILPTPLLNPLPFPTK
jgi:hypothetical protein